MSIPQCSPLPPPPNANRHNLGGVLTKHVVLREVLREKCLNILLRVRQSASRCFCSLTYLGEFFLFVEGDVRQRQTVPSMHVPVLVADRTVDHLARVQRYLLSEQASEPEICVVGRHQRGLSSCEGTHVFEGNAGGDRSRKCVRCLYFAAC